MPVHAELLIDFEEGGDLACSHVADLMEELPIQRLARDGYFLRLYLPPDARVPAVQADRLVETAVVSTKGCCNWRLVFFKYFEAQRSVEAEAKEDDTSKFHNFYGVLETLKTDG